MWLWRGNAQDDDTTDEEAEEIRDAVVTSSEEFSNSNTHPKNTNTIDQALSPPPPSSTSKRRLRTWNTAFRDTCLQNGTIHASIVQVTEEHPDVVDDAEIPTTVSTAFYFHQQGTNEKLVERFKSSEINNKQQQQQETKPVSKSSTVSSYVINKAVSVTKYAAKILFQNVNDIIMEQAVDSDDDEAQDDNAQQTAEEEDPFLDPTEPILNFDLAIDCLTFLRDVIISRQQDDEILALPGGPSTAPAVCQQWISRILLQDDSFCGQEKIRTLIQQMASKDLQFLLEALIKCGIVEIVKRRPQQDDLLVFSSSRGGKEEDAASKQVKLAMFDLTRQINLIQTRIDILSERKDKCAKDALKCRKNKQEQQAMYHMKLRKKLEEEILSSQGKIHNLEEQRMGLENASSNREILQVSQQTAKTLKSIREQTENADEILEELQEEIDSHNVVQEALAHTANLAAGGVMDEEELLAELEALDLNDVDQSGGSAAAASSKPTTTSEEPNTTTTTTVAPVPTFGIEPPAVDQVAAVGTSEEATSKHDSKGHEEPTAMIEA